MDTEELLDLLESIRRGCEVGEILLRSHTDQAYLVPTVLEDMGEKAIRVLMEYCAKSGIID